ncbi:MAG: hypothetical protein AAB696_01195 [Patescibacteria group bacterium]
MKNYKIFIFLFFIFVLSFGFLNIASAQEEGLVPCGPGITGATSCNFCHLLTLGQNIINYALIIVFPISAVMVVVGGGYILTAGASESNVSKGKEILTAAIVGLIIALCSWLIIDIIIRAISNDTNTNWYEIGSKVGCP